MKRRVIKRVQRREQPREEFYEAMPAAPAQPVYREGPVYRDDEPADRLFSGWAILGLIVLGLVVLLLLFGRTSMTPAVNLPSNNSTNTAPTTDSPTNTPAQ